MGRTKRTFDTGATRDSEEGKHDYEGFLSPLALEAFGEYMTKHRKQVDGTLRDSDNWQKGIPLASYMKSMIRHVFTVWMHHRGYGAKESLDDALAGVMFNAMGYLHTVRKARKEECREQMDPVNYDPVTTEYDPGPRPFERNAPFEAEPDFVPYDTREERAMDLPKPQWIG